MYYVETCKQAHRQQYSRMLKSNTPYSVFMRTFFARFYSIWHNLKFFSHGFPATNLSCKNRISCTRKHYAASFRKLATWRFLATLFWFSSYYNWILLLFKYFLQLIIKYIWLFLQCMLKSFWHAVLAFSTLIWTLSACKLIALINVTA